jgi:hypothetical protein
MEHLHHFLHVKPILFAILLYGWLRIQQVQISTSRQEDLTKMDFQTRFTSFPQNPFDLAWSWRSIRLWALEQEHASDP